MYVNKEIKMRGDEYRVRFPGNCENTPEQEGIFFAKMEELTGRSVFSYWGPRGGDHPPTVVHSLDSASGRLYCESHAYNRDGLNRVAEAWRQATLEARALGEPVVGSVVEMPLGRWVSTDGQMAG